MFDIVIKNGEIIDGTGKSRKTALDLAIQNGRVVALDHNIPESKAQTVVDATGQLVAPGFIDIQNHSDSYWTLFDQPQQTSLLSQGITTIIAGNCGSSLAPIPGPESIKTIQKWHNLAGINFNWTTFAEFLHVLSKQKLGVNVGSLIGHATIRRGLLKDAVRPATWDEIKMMDKLVWQSLSQGAFGLSLGLMYAHEMNSSKEELTEMAKNLKSGSGFLSVHLRSESAQIVESLDEVLDLAASTGVPLKISHLKVQGKKNWHLHSQIVNRLETAFHKGMDVTFDVYPYSSSWLVLYTYLPKWAYEGGSSEIMRAINSPDQRKKIVDYLKAQEYDYDQIVIATSENNPAFVGKSISQVAESANTSKEEALLNVLLACTTQAMVFDHNLSREQVDVFLASPLSMVATDGAGYTEKSRNLVHPRCFGAFPKFLRWVREKKTIGWEEAIRKIAGEPARLLGMKDRGVIAKNSIADLVIFDPNTVGDEATYAQPFQISAGINQVFIGGNLAYKDNQTTGMFGSVIRKL